jgi:class 3 adenylate cyclase
LESEKVCKATTPEPPHHIEDLTQVADNIEAIAAVAVLPMPQPLPDESIGPSVPFSPEEVDVVFPWHMACDVNFRVVSLGSNLALRFDGVGPNTSMCSLVRIVHPMLDTLSFESVAHLQNTDVMLLVRDTMYLAKTQGYTNDHTTSDDGVQQHLPGGTPTLSPEDLMGCRRDSIASVPYIACNPEYLYLRGEFLVRHDDGPERPPTGIVFLGTPSCGTLEQMNDLKISFDDIPIHSNGREVMHSHIQQRVTAELAQELLDMRSELDEAVAELRLEKAKQDALLHSILPPNIAEQLARGIRPPACKHVNVSMLFSDIVSFTAISSAASPNEIMDMLDNLFSRFDQLCEKHGVYKLETIGDAYLVTSGLPEACEDHADRLAAFAVDMLNASKRVLRPDTNEPLQIRVGLHTGSVTAGVAGTSRPRYCVFGDTVNVASRMESTSENGRIQLSGEFRRELLDAQRFKLVSRGTIDIKGKGPLQTFFLDGLHDDGLYPKDRAPRMINVAGMDDGDTITPASSSSLGIGPRLGRTQTIHDHDSGLSSKSRSVSPSGRSKGLPPRSDPKAHSQGYTSSVSTTDQSVRSTDDDVRTDGTTTRLSEPACRPRLRYSDPSPGIERTAGRPRGASESAPPTVSPSPVDAPSTGLQKSGETRRSGRNLRAQRTSSARVMARSPAVGVGSHTSSPPTDAESIDIAVFEETAEGDEFAPGEPATCSPTLGRANSTGSLSPHKQRRPRHMTTSASTTALQDTYDYREAATGTGGPLSPDKSVAASRPYSASSVITVGECDFDLVVKVVADASGAPSGARAGANDEVLSFLDGTLTLKQVAEGLEDANAHERVLFYADATGQRQLAPSLTLISLHKAMVRRGIRNAGDLELHVWRRLPQRNGNSTSV